MSLLPLGDTFKIKLFSKTNKLIKDLYCNSSGNIMSITFTLQLCSCINAIFLQGSNRIIKSQNISTTKKVLYLYHTFLLRKKPCLPKDKNKKLDSTGCYIYKTQPHTLKQTSMTLWYRQHVQQWRWDGSKDKHQLTHPEPNQSAVLCDGWRHSITHV